MPREGVGKCRVTLSIESQGVNWALAVYLCRGKGLENIMAVNIEPQGGELGLSCLLLLRDSVKDVE